MYLSVEPRDAPRTFVTSRVFVNLLFAARPAGSTNSRRIKKFAADFAEEPQPGIAAAASVLLLPLRRPKE
jgi:hypothetical protein